MFCIPDTDYTKYKSAEVFLKNDKISKILIEGKIEAVHSDTNIVTIKTADKYAVFDNNDVIAIRFI